MDGGQVCPLLKPYLLLSWKISPGDNKVETWEEKRWDSWGLMTTFLRGEKRFGGNSVKKLGEKTVMQHNTFTNMNVRIQARFSGSNVLSTSFSG